MEAIFPFPRPDRLTLQIATVSLLGVALVLAREASYGVALSGDTAFYVSAARSALAGQGFYQFDGSPLAAWPLFYPLTLLAVADLGAFDPLSIVGPLNVGIFGMIVFVVGNYLRHRLESRFLVVWVCVVLALSIPLADIASRGGSEPLFILLVILALIQTDKVLVHGRRSALFWAAVFSALAWQTRYIGVAVPVVVGFLLLFQREQSWSLRAGRIAIYWLLVAAPMGLWLLGNQRLGDAAVGGRPWRMHDPWQRAADVGDAVWGWLDFDLPLLEWPDSVALNIVVVLALLGFVGFALVAMRRRQRPPFDWRPCWLFGGFGLICFALLLVLDEGWYSSAAPPPNFAAPIFVPLLVTVSFALDWLLGRERQARLSASISSASVQRNVLAGALSVALAAWAAGQVLPNARAIDRENSVDGNTRDLSAPRWRFSETLRYIRENPMHGTVFSNQIGLVYLNNAGTARYASLLDYFGSRGYGFGSEERELAEVPDGAYMIWFRDWNSRRFPLGEAQMRVTAGLAPVADLADGSIFKAENGYVPHNPYSQAYQRVVAGELGAPAARSVFDLYRAGRTLIYVKRSCAINDIREPFFLHFTHADGSVGSSNFHFAQTGAMLDNDTCVALARLPERVLQHVRTGQFSKRDLWSAEPEIADLDAMGANNG